MTRIGVFDSGLGGLTVLRELSKTNKAQYFYFGDTLRVPYGGRSREELIGFACDIVDFLEKFDIDYYVIACNTLRIFWLISTRRNLFPSPKWDLGQARLMGGLS